MTLGFRRAHLVGGLLGALALLPSDASASRIIGNIGVGFGEQWISQPSYWERRPDDGRREATVNVMLGHRALPIALDAYAARTHGTVDTPFEYVYDETSYEVGMGLAGVCSVGWVHPYAGGGIASITSRAKPVDPPGDTTLSVTRWGPWIGAGAFVDVVAGFNVGIAGRAANVDTDYGGNLGGLSASAFLGWGWPAGK